MKVKGRLQLDIFKTVDGKKIKIGGFDDSNLITLSGKQVMAYLLAGEPGTHKVSKFGIGTGDSFPDDYDVGLTNAVINNTTGYYFLEPTVVQWYFSVPANEGTGLLVTEFGLFSETEQLFARKIRTPGITKDSSISFSGAWTVWLMECKKTTFFSYVVFDWDMVSQIGSSNVVSIQPLIEHSIISSGNAERILAAQADIVSGIASSSNTPREFISTADIVSDIPDPTFDFTNVERRFLTVPFVRFDLPETTVIFNLGDFMSQADIEFNINNPAFEPLDWTGFGGDDFTGDDDDPPNVAVWTVAPEPKKPAKIKTNKLKYILALDEEGEVSSKFKMTGEFDIQVSFDVISETDESYATLAFFDSLTTPLYGGYIGIYFDGVKMFSSNYLVDGTWESRTTRPRGDTFGGLKITRTDTDLFTTFEKDGTDGFSNLKMGRHTTDDMYIYLTAYGTGGGAITFTFDDFIINSGTPISGS